MRPTLTLALCAGVLIALGCGGETDDPATEPQTESGATIEPLPESDPEGWQLLHEFPDTRALDAEIERLRALVAEDGSSVSISR